MKKFLAIYACAENSKNHQAWMKLTQEEQKERFQKGMLAKDQWSEKYKHQIIFEPTSLGEKTKRVDSQGITEFPSLMGAITIVTAESHESASEMFLEHPRFAIFPGDAIEIIECLDAPRV